MGRFYDFVKSKEKELVYVGCDDKEDSHEFNLVAPKKKYGLFKQTVSIEYLKDKSGKEYIFMNRLEMDLSSTELADLCSIFKKLIKEDTDKYYHEQEEALFKSLGI